MVLHLLPHCCDILPVPQPSLRLTRRFPYKGMVMEYLLCSEISLKTKPLLSSPLADDFFFTCLTQDFHFVSRVLGLIYLKALNTDSACRYCCCHGNEVIYAS